MAGSTGPDIIRKNLVLAYDSGNHKVNSAASFKDLTGNKTLTLQNSPTFDSSNKNRLKFDGTDDYLDITPISYTNITVMGWLNRTAVGNGPFNITGGTGIVQYFSVYINRLSYAYETSVTWAQGSTVLSTNTWYHYALVYDHSTTTVKFYLNGVEEGWSVGSGSVRAGYRNGTLYRFGKYYQSDIRRWNGYLPRGLVYTDVLTSDEVLQNYNQTKSRFI